MRTQNGNKYLFVLTRSETLEGNLKFIYDELVRQKPNAVLVVVSCQNKMDFRLFKELHHLSDTNAVFLDDYYLPIYLIKPKKELKIVQLWHAAGAFKKFGYSTVGTKFGADAEYLRIVPIHSNYTHVYVSSKHAKKYYAEAFNMSVENIFSLGVPRVDLFSNKEKEKATKAQIYQHYPLLKDEKTVNVLYAPTYRAIGQHKESAFDLFQCVQNISNKMEKNKRLLVKLHPYIQKQNIHDLKKLTNVLIVENFSINEWMFVSDAFITDYSSAVFEFALLNKPLIHYVPDYQEYKENRGFYKDIADTSDGELVETEDALIRWLNALSKHQTFDTKRMVALNFDYTQDVSERIIKHFLAEEGGVVHESRAYQ